MVKKIFRNKLFIGLSIPMVSWAIFLMVFYLWNGFSGMDFKPIPNEVPEGFRSTEAGVPLYHRPVESTYLTFPEWYLVFNPQEYAAFIATDRPSRFPYFSSIVQFWSGYGRVYGIAKHHFPFDAGDNLMEAVIGTSFTLEYVIKGVWENTLGRFSEWSSAGAKVEEDLYAARTAREYGDYIPFEPWFEFPFGHKLTGLWRDTGLWGSHPLRKIERKLFLSLEYGGKALYALPIRLASRCVYGVADTEVDLAVEKAPEGIFQDPKVRLLRKVAKDSYIITLPHYQGFTDILPSLVKEGVEFVDIAGNSEILVTAVAPKDWKVDPQCGTLLFAMDMMANQGQKRLALQVPVRSLSPALKALGKEGVRLEHLFDY